MTTPIEDLTGCETSERVLHAELESAQRGQIDPSRPSLLPGWSVGHVLTHLARNADAMRSMAEGAAAGEMRPMYPSAEAREDAIQAGAGRPLDQLMADVIAAGEALLATWADLSEAGWDGYGLTRFGPMPIGQCPWRRRREVEVHLVDLGLRYEPRHWPDDYVQADLARRHADWIDDGSAPLPDDVTAGEPWQQLAWLLGRASGLASPAPQWA